MGGQNHQQEYKLQKYHNDNDQLIWSAIIELSEKHLDEFPINAKEIAVSIGREKSGSMITRERGGLKCFLINYRGSFISSLSELVNGEKSKTGNIDIVFCRKLGFMVVSHYALFAIDVVTMSHRNTSFMVEELRPLLNSSYILFFSAELYSLLKEWHYEEFTSESVWLKYGKRLQALIIKYQTTRPNMATSSRSEDARTKLSNQDSSFFINHNEEYK